FAVGTKVNGVERVRACDDNGAFEFDKLYKYQGQLLVVGNEMDFNLKDPICLTEVLANYLVVKGAIFGIATACGVRKPMPHPNPVDDFKILALASRKINDTACRSAFLAGGLSSVTTALLSLGAPYEVAKAEFKRVRVCGSDWLKPDPKNYEITKKEGSYFESVEKNRHESDKYKWEYFFGGKEFPDVTNNPDETCFDPETSAPQKYYLRGLQPGNYNCENYNPANQDQTKKDLYKKAYDCCRQKRKKYICLEKYG
ncbi:MAG: hypothetical protein ACKOXJ_01710, partial [Alphaproteobacteria bacterium]